MRLLKRSPGGDLSMKLFDDDKLPPYAMLSHRWTDEQEVTYHEFVSGTGKDKSGYDKIRFCVDRAAIDGIEYAWVDTCCIDRSTSDELSTAINSMFRWYQHAAKCYVYLSDVEVPDEVVDPQAFPITWKNAFRRSRWFTRGWTLQELLAPATVDFFSRGKKWLGSKISLEQDIHEITKIPIRALRQLELSEFSVDERISWRAGRTTTMKEDKAYCLLGILEVYLPLIYGEGEEHAMQRLRDEVALLQYRQSLAATATVDPSDTFKRASLKGKRSLSVNEEMPRIPQKDSIRGAIGTMQKFSNYIQTQLRDGKARKITLRLETILDAMRQAGRLQDGHQEHQWTELKDSLLLSKRVSVNSRPPPLSLVQDSRIKRRCHPFKFEQWDITLTTTYVNSHDEDGREVLQSLSAIRLQPCCSNTASSVTVFLGERLDAFQRSLINPVILAYRTIPSDSEVFGLIKNDDVEGVKRLLAEQKATTRDCDEDGRSLLFYACHFISPLCCRFLIESGADVNRSERHFSPDGGQITPLLQAVIGGGSSGHASAQLLQCSRYLLEADADPTIETGPSENAVNVALGFGGRGGTTATIDQILRLGKVFIDLKSPVFYGFTLWLCACGTAGILRTPMVFRSLLDAGCNPNETDAHGRNGLFYCVSSALFPGYSQDFEALQFLLRLPIDIYAKDHTGRTVSDHVNDSIGSSYGRYRQDLWYCALRRAGYDVPHHIRMAKYTDFYTPRHYDALRYLSAWDPDDMDEQLQRLEGKVPLTTDECIETARLEALSDEYTVELESFSPLDSDMEDHFWVADDGGEDKDDEDEANDYDQADKGHSGDDVMEDVF